MRRAVALLATWLCAVAIGLVGADMTAAAQPILLATAHSYDTVLAPAALTDIDVERGPPSANCGDTTYKAAERWSSGASVRSGDSATSATYTYDHPETLVQVAQATTTTGGQAVLPDADLLSLLVGQVAAEDGMAGVRAAGRTGEELAGIVKNTEHIPSASGTAAYRIPDELNSSVIGEVKNVARQGYTRQLRDFVSYAESNSLTFNLYVRESTTFTTPLQNMIDSGVITRVPNLGP